MAQVIWQACQVLQWDILNMELCGYTAGLIHKVHHESVVYDFFRKDFALHIIK